MPDRVHHASQRNLISENVCRFLIEIVGPPVDNLKVSGVLLFPNQLSNEGSHRLFDEHGAVSIRLGSLINDSEQVLRECDVGSDFHVANILLLQRLVKCCSLSCAVDVLSTDFLEQTLAPACKCRC